MLGDGIELGGEEEEREGVSWLCNGGISVLFECLFIYGLGRQGHEES